MLKQALLYFANECAISSKTNKQTRKCSGQFEFRERRLHEQFSSIEMLGHLAPSEFRFPAHKYCLERSWDTAIQTHQEADKILVTQTLTVDIRRMFEASILKQGYHSAECHLHVPGFLNAACQIQWIRHF
jgi:hypothetical protein